ncbi:ImmA/IrrE family metallo-endopeptidase [Bacillus solitudinis]|uniref:ImmA/IrrE family metallo-endopeptidase n=1 Tax=Bacillus solitudinis TaxID=2014074 RepID=UPI000C230E6C|nr:ImmA/IrrE family metallo-endopeptidase [Bacillus solitudinis]
MNMKKRKAINALADSLFDTLELTFPVAVEDVPEILGGELIIKEFENNELEAMIRKVDDSFEIQISPDKPNFRKRFSIAHEIGHLFLHMGYLMNPKLWNEVGDYRDSVFYRLGHSIEEKEANEFAGAFLMPEQEFIKISRENLENGRYDLEKISKYFDVSQEAALVRGKTLGLISWG